MADVDVSNIDYLAGAKLCMQEANREGTQLGITAMATAATARATISIAEDVRAIRTFIEKLA